MSKLIINKRWFFYILVFAILIAMGIYTLEEDLWLSISIITIGVLLVLGYAIFIPNSYRIDKAQITVYYCFGIKTTALWDQLKLVEDHHSNKSAFPWHREYHIGYFKVKCPIWQIAYLPKNKKTEILISKYSKVKINKVG